MAHMPAAGSKPVRTPEGEGRKKGKKNVPCHYPRSMLSRSNKVLDKNDMINQVFF